MTLKTRNNLRIFLGWFLLVFAIGCFVMIYRALPDSVKYQGKIISKEVFGGNNLMKVEIPVPGSSTGTVIKVRKASDELYFMATVGQSCEFSADPWYLSPDHDSKQSHALIFIMTLTAISGICISFGIVFLTNKDIFMPEEIKEIFCDRCRKREFEIVKLKDQVEQFKKLKFLEDLK